MVQNFNNLLQILHYMYVIKHLLFLSIAARLKRIASNGKLSFCLRLNYLNYLRQLETQ